MEPMCRNLVNAGKSLEFHPALKDSGSLNLVFGAKARSDFRVGGGGFGRGGVFAVARVFATGVGGRIVGVVAVGGVGGAVGIVIAIVVVVVIVVVVGSENDRTTLDWSME